MPITLPQLNTIQIMMLMMGGSAVLMTALEGVAISRSRGPEAYDWRAFWTAIRINLWRVVVEAIPMGAVMGVALPFGAWMYEQRLWTVPMDTWWGWVAMFFCTEFFYYWMHRAGHRIRWYWASHMVHHSGNQYNLSTAFRQSITGKISGAFVFFAPQCLLGFSPDAVLISYGINLVYQFWIHTDVIGKLGWMEGVLNTPSAHRVHHGANPEYLDCNYGGTIMLFDRIFGSYVPERDDVPVRVGLVKPLTTYNALAICMFEWGNLLRDVLRARSLREVAGYMFGPPGWAPDGQGLTTEGLRAQLAQEAQAASAATAPAAVAERRPEPAANDGAMPAAMAAGGR